MMLMTLRVVLPHTTIPVSLLKAGLKQKSYNAHDATCRLATNSTISLLKAGLTPEGHYTDEACVSLPHAPKCRGGNGQT